MFIDIRPRVDPEFLLLLRRERKINQLGPVVISI